MASQCDFFDQSQVEVDTGRKLSASLPNYFYKWVILFQWNMDDNKSRFKIFERNLFPEIKDEWMKGQLKEVSRAKKLKKLEAEEGEFSLFAKVESGKSKNYFTNE